MPFRHQSEARGLLFLEASGHTLLWNNYRTAWCELDLITLDKDLIIHVTEVKNWKGDVLRHPLHVFSHKRIALCQKSILNFIGEKNDDYNIISIIAKMREKTQTRTKSIIRLDQLSISFDLLWLKGKDDIEYHTGLF